MGMTLLSRLAVATGLSLVATVAVSDTHAPDPLADLLDFLGNEVQLAKATSVPDPAEISLDSVAVSLDELDTSRGRQDVMIDIGDVDMLIQKNDGEQSASLADNLMKGNFTTGNNLIEAGAMSGMQGIATVIQNTGNQVVIQDTTMVNILIRP